MRSPSAANPQKHRTKSSSSSLYSSAPGDTARQVWSRRRHRAGADSPLQAEDEQHRRRGCVLELGRLRDDVVRLPRAYQHRDVLLAVYRIGHRRGIDAGADIEAPQLFERFRVVGTERAVDMAEEDEVAGSRQRAGEVSIVEPLARLGLARGRVHGFESAVKAGLRSLEGTAGKALTRLHGTALVGAVFLLDSLDRTAALDRWDIDETELRIICGGLPVLDAG